MNFLQKGLAGLESRLDKVLLDEPDRLEQQSKRDPHAQLEPGKRSVDRSRRSVEKDVRHNPISSQPPPAQGMTMNSRVSMQERLAAAVARKAATGGRSESPVPGGRGSRTASPAPSSKEEVNGRVSVDSTRAAKDTKGEPEPVKQNLSSAPVAPPAPADVDTEPRPEPETSGSAPNLEPQPESSQLPGDSPRQSLESTIQPLENGHTNGDDNFSREELLSTISQLRADLTLCESRRASESHASSERIDALEEKIRYLARESAEASRRKATNTSAGGLEKKLAEAQEKIALLLEEGEMLSKNELKLQNTIKKLRVKTQEEEKGAQEAKRRLEKAEKEAGDVKEKLWRAAEDAKRDKERIKGVAKLENELQVLKREKESAVATIAELKEKVVENTRRAEDAESRAQTEALESERKITADLRAEIERVQSEATLTEERLNSEVADLKSKIARDAERARTMEQELKGEQMIMESKMEALRARAEEVSSGASGDAHAKLLRQVETLQTQYAIASENWQGIEGSMLGRIASLEKERDDLSKKEGDLRRKARELSIKSKNLDMDLDTAHSRIKDLESDLSTSQETVSTLQAKLTKLETDLTSLRTDFDHEREAWQRDLQTRVEEERTKWDREREEASRPSSPMHMHMAPPSLPPLRKVSGPLSTTESYFVGFTRKPSRSPSVEASTPVEYYNNRRGFSTPPIGVRHDSALSLPQANASRISLPTAAEEDDTDYFENIPFSPNRGDMVSVSTVAAGPSVQLVERMSATVRRLESEMTGAREEVAAITAQRDEARREIVELMREVEEKRGSEEKVKVLEREVESMKRREETTLEMLGEKSELVEELRADVADLKQMYRDLVSDTMR